MNQWVRIFLFAFIICSAVPSFAFPPWVYVLIASASRAKPDTLAWHRRWNRVDRYLTKNPRANIDYSDEKRLSGRTLFQHHNRDLYNRHFVDLDAFDFVRNLGTGRFGTVKLVRYRPTGSLFALKFLKKDQYLKEKLPYPPREPELMKGLRHPNILRLYRTIEQPHGIALVTEYVEGEELFYYIANRKYLSEEECRELMWQLLSALEYLHEHGICHRDLKPENILINEYGELKIIDFGLGNFCGRDAILNTFCGSPDFACPEVYLGKGYHGEAADVWTLGVLLFGMANGRLPFEDAKAIVMLNLSWPSQPRLSNELRDLLWRILQYESNRYTLDDILNHPWMQEKSVLPLDLGQAVSIIPMSNYEDFLPSLSLILLA